MSEISTVDPASALLGKPLENLVYDSKVGGFVLMTDQECPHGYTPATPAVGTLRVEVNNERNVTKSRLKVTSIVSQSSPSDTILSEPSDFLRKFVCSINRVTTHGDSTLAPDTGLYVISSEVTEINANNYVKVTEWATEFVAQVTTFSDEQGQRFTKTESIVARSSAPPADTTTTVYNQQDISCTKALRTAITRVGDRTVFSASCDDETCLQVITETVPLAIENTETAVSGAQVCEPGVESVVSNKQTHYELTTRTLKDWETYSKVSFLTAPYNHPTYFQATDVTLFYSYSTVQSSESFGFRINARWGFVCETETKIIETLVDSVPNEVLEETTGTGDDAVTDTWMQVRTSDLYFDGDLFRLQIQNTLHDGNTFTATTGTVNATYYPLVESYTPRVSVPTATEYIALVAAGQWVKVKDVYTPWKYCLWKRTRTYIKPL